MRAHLQITGEMPKELCGTLYRTVPTRNSRRAGHTTGSAATA